MSLACPGLVADLSPDLCRAIDIYCERTSPAFDAEPINALTNIAYVVAGLAAWRLSRRRPNPDAAGLIAALIASVFAVAVGSFLFHTVGTVWASWADVVPILVFMLLMLWVTLRRFFGWPVAVTAISLVIFGGLTVSAEAFVPARLLWGGAYAVPSLVLLFGAGSALVALRAPAGWAYLSAGGLFVLSFVFRTLDMPYCAAWPTGLHFFWHLLNATLVFLLIRAVILYAPSPPPRPPR